MQALHPQITDPVMHSKEIKQKYIYLNIICESMLKKKLLYWNNK